MPRLAVPLVILLVVVIGALFVLQTLPKHRPTSTVEVAVQPGGNAG